MTNPTADYIARIIRREHEKHRTPKFKLISADLPEIDPTEEVKVFGDVIEFHHCNGMDYFVPVHQVKVIAHQSPDTVGEEDTYWAIYI